MDGIREVKNYFFTNDFGDEITVTEEHIDNAIDVKLQLQQANPGQRANWKQLVKEMRRRGFEEAEHCEGYRCLIKYHQKKKGLLHEVGRHAELVTTKKVEALKNIVGELKFEKQSNRDLLNEIRKFERQYSRDLAIIEVLQEELDYMDFGNIVNKIKVERLPDGKKQLIIIFSDWHIGALIDHNYNTYNFEIAKKRISLFIEKVIQQALIFDIDNVAIFDLGDIVEGSYMRKNQEFEFPYSVQTVKATQLVVEAIVALAEFFNVDYYSVSGNHDRVNGDKGANQRGDNASKVVNESVSMIVNYLIERSNTKRIRVIPYNEDKIETVIKGKLFALQHGHALKGKPGKKIGYINSNKKDGEKMVDILVYGHIHRYTITEASHGRLEISAPSLMGVNDYAEEIGATLNPAAQIALIVDEEMVTPLYFPLQTI